MDDTQAAQSILGTPQETSSQDDVSAASTILGTPSDVLGAQQTIGDQNDNGECQRFVEKITTGHSGIYPSAAAAYQDQAQKGNVNSDFSQMRPGDLLYFSDPSQPNGHVGIVDGNDSMISATYQGVKQSTVSDWLKATGQTPLGFIRGFK